MNLKRCLFGLGISAICGAHGLAATIFTANSISLSYTSNSSSVSESYSFLGPDLNVSGGAATAVGPLAFTSPGTSFFVGLPAIDSDVGIGGGMGTAGGVVYTSLAFSSGSLLLAGPFVLTAGSLSETLPEVLTGSITACSTYAACNAGTGTDVFSISYSVPGLLTVTATPLSASMYVVTSAQFTSTPEPGSAWMLSGSLGLFLVGMCIRRMARG